MISIFTPTYNRAYILKQLYDSLINQTCYDFEWIIVDDGSTDETKCLVETFCENTPFPIYYYYKENEGKHVAINFGVKKANGEWFFIVDSDDVLPINSIETIKKYCEPLYSNDDFAGIAGVISTRNGDIIGNAYDFKYIDMTSAKFRKKYFGDKAEVIKTKIIKKYIFPSFEGEKFMQESVLWLSISNDGYLIRWINEVIYNRDYIDDGLTKNGKLVAMKSPLSRSYADNHILGSKDILLSQRIKSCINYYRYGNFGGKTYRELFKCSNSKFLSLIGIIISIIYPIRKVQKYDK